MNEQVMRKWHFWQTVAQIVLVIIFVGYVIINPFHMVAKQRARNVALVILMMILLLPQFTLLRPDEPNNRWQQFNHYLQVILIGLGLQGSVSLLLAMLLKFHILNINFWVVLVTLYTLVMYLPMGQLALAKIQNNWGRIIMLACFVFTIVLAGPSLAGAISYFRPLKLLNDTGVTGSIALILFTLPVMHAWGFASPHFKLSKNSSWTILGLILLFMIADLSFDSFNDYSSWKNILTAWDFQPVKVSWTFALQAVEAGIAEEWLMRYCVFRLILRSFKKWRNFLIWSVLTDGIIFGLWHFSNVSGQPLSATLEQMLSAGSWALVVAAIYLYTDSFAVNMLYHGVWDLLAFFMSGTVHESVPTAIDWQVDIILLIVYVAMAYFLITGKRKQTIEDNLSTSGI